MKFSILQLSKHTFIINLYHGVLILKSFNRYQKDRIIRDWLLGSINLKKLIISLMFVFNKIRIKLSLHQYVKKLLWDIYNLDGSSKDLMIRAVVLIIFWIFSFNRFSINWPVQCLWILWVSLCGISLYRGPKYCIKMTKLESKAIQ